MTLSELDARRFARLSLDCVHREYPNKIAHVLQSDADVRPPRELTPAFYGCFDWHSAVHGHWTLARLARLFPASEFAAEARAKLSRSMTEQNISAEIQYLTGTSRESFERPYGLAWLLMLAAELRLHDQHLARVLTPLEHAARQKMEIWLAKLPRPDRSGQHANTAFSLGLAMDAISSDSERSALPWFEAASRLFAEDRDAPLHLEPAGEDFLSPTLAEADLMRRLYAPPKFALWLTRFLPRIDKFEPTVSPDRTDGKLAHLDGLNLSRAWMLRGIANGLPSNDPRRPLLLDLAEVHRSAGLASVSAERYESAHWLATFAVYLETQSS